MQEVQEEAPMQVPILQTPPSRSTSNDSDDMSGGGGGGGSGTSMPAKVSRFHICIYTCMHTYTVGVLQCVVARAAMCVWVYRRLCVGVGVFLYVHVCVVLLLIGGEWQGWRRRRCRAARSTAAD
jgi:hypothetical protein